MCDMFKTVRDLILVAMGCDMELVIDSLRDRAISKDSFKRSLKTFLFLAYSCTQRIRAFWTMRSTNLLTYLVTINH